VQYKYIFINRVIIMSKRFFLDDKLTEDGKYRVLQEDTETKEPLGFQDFDTEEEAQEVAEGMQQAIDNVLSERTTGDLPELPVSIGDSSNTADDSEFKGTLQDLKPETSEE
jgi:hypothetical protein